MALLPQQHLLTAVGFLHDIGKAAHRDPEREVPEPRPYFQHARLGYEMLMGQSLPSCFKSEDGDSNTPELKSLLVRRAVVQECHAAYGKANCPFRLSSQPEFYIFDANAFFNNWLSSLDMSETARSKVKPLFGILVAMHGSLGPVVSGSKPIGWWLSNLQCLARDANYEHGKADLLLAHMAAIIGAADAHGLGEVKTNNNYWALPPSCPAVHRDVTGSILASHDRLAKGFTASVEEGLRILHHARSNTFDVRGSEGYLTPEILRLRNLRADGHHHFYQSECRLVDGERGLPFGPLSVFFERYFSVNFKFHEGNLLEHAVWTAKAVEDVMAIDGYAAPNDQIKRELLGLKPFLAAVGFIHDLGKAGNPLRRVFGNVIHHAHYGYEMLTGKRLPHCFRHEDDLVHAPLYPYRIDKPARFRITNDELDECIRRYGKSVCRATKDNHDGSLYFNLAGYINTVVWPSIGITSSLEKEEMNKLMAILVAIHTGFGFVVGKKYTPDWWMDNLDCLVKAEGYNGGVTNLLIVHAAVIINAADIHGSNVVETPTVSSLRLPTSCPAPRRPGRPPAVMPHKLTWHSEMHAAFAKNHLGTAWLLQLMRRQQPVHRFTEKELAARGLDVDLAQALDIVQLSDAAGRDDSKEAPVDSDGTTTTAPKPGLLRGLLSKALEAARGVKNHLDGFLFPEDFEPEDAASKEEPDAEPDEAESDSSAKKDARKVQLKITKEEEDEPEKEESGGWKSWFDWDPYGI
eukprot:GILK01003079.1.p1 GENE.GILK01003079.1~~GILK01003079.1.p1  ORF type:complete len:847 (+),score=87.48 GILK01003079.1:304-2541(+)